MGYTKKHNSFNTLGNTVVMSVSIFKFTLKR